MEPRRALMEVRCESQWMELVASLLADDSEERAAALERLRPQSAHDVWALTRMGAVLALIHATADPDLHVRRIAVELLGHYHSMLLPVETMLRDALHHETNPSLRFALERLVEHLAVPPLWLESRAHLGEATDA